MVKKKEPETTPRWKCPDCSAWIRDDVEVHKCEPEKAEEKPVWNGHQCSKCGGWVWPGTVHYCYYTTGGYTCSYCGAWVSYQGTHYCNGRWPNITVRYTNNANTGNVTWINPPKDDDDGDAKAAV